MEDFANVKDWLVALAINHFIFAFNISFADAFCKYGGRRPHCPDRGRSSVNVIEIVVLTLRHGQISFWEQ